MCRNVGSATALLCVVTTKFDASVKSVVAVAIAIMASANGGKEK